METVRQPRVKIVYEGRDITQDIEKYLISVDYTDNTGNNSDEVSFTVHDTDGMWRGAWFPFKGDKLTLEIGYDNDLLNCGIFTVDEIQMQGPPDTVSIRALAAGINSPLRTKNSKAFEGQSLKQIAQEIAGKYAYEIVDSETNTSSRKVSFEDDRKQLTNLYAKGVQAVKIFQLSSHGKQLSSVASSIEGKGKASEAATLRRVVSAIEQAKPQFKGKNREAELTFLKNLRIAWATAIKTVQPNLVDYTNTRTQTNSVLDGIRITRVTQNRETDLEFLARVAGEFGIMFSIRDSKIIFIKVADVENSEAVTTIDRTELISYSIKEKSTKVYKKATVTHHNKKSNKITKAEIEANKQKAEAGELRINSEHASAEDTLVIYSKVDNMQQAEQKARAALHLANSKHQEGNITIPGNPLFVAGNNFDLTSMGSLSGKFNIVKSSHRIGRDGYTTDLEIKRIGDITNVGEKQTLGDVLFDTDSDVIRPAGLPEIDKVIDYMVKNPETVIEVGGHTDSDAGTEYNQKLSERRAKAVREYMISKGILATRLIPKGYGEVKPVASNSTPDGKQKNRRTEFVVIRNNS